MATAAVTGSPLGAGPQEGRGADSPAFRRPPKRSLGAAFSPDAFISPPPVPKVARAVTPFFTECKNSLDASTYPFEGTERVKRKIGSGQYSTVFRLEGTVSVVKIPDFKNYDTRNPGMRKCIVRKADYQEIFAGWAKVNACLQQAEWSGVPIEPVTQEGPVLRQRFLEGTALESVSDEQAISIARFVSLACHLKISFDCHVGNWLVVEGRAVNIDPIYPHDLEDSAVEFSSSLRKFIEAMPMSETAMATLLAATEKWSDVRDLLREIPPVRKLLPIEEIVAAAEAF